MKLLIASLTFGVFSLFLPRIIWAADLSVSCGNDGCLPHSSPSLFPNDNWYPGRVVEKTVQVSNSGSNQLTIASQSQNQTTTGSLDEVMHLTISRSSDNLTIWSGSFHDFYTASSVAIDNLVAGGSDSFAFAVSMDKDAGDLYQGKSTSYDLVLSFSGGSAETSSPTSQSGNSSAPACNDQKPGSAPVLTNAVAGINKVTLFWNQATDPVSYYLVAYGTAAGAQTFGNPNIGGQGTTSYVVSSLSGGSTYYFRIRAGNGCAPGDYSNELSATPTGGQVSVPAAGFVPGVLGEATPNGPETTEVGNGSFLSWSRVLTGFLLLLILLLFIVRRLWLFLRRRYPSRFPH